MAKATNHGLIQLRMKMFARLQNADLALFKQQTASALGNTLVFEVQNGALLMGEFSHELGARQLDLDCLGGLPVVFELATEFDRGHVVSCGGVADESFKQTLVPNHTRHSNSHR
jgi:hypothetical protein